MPLGYNRILGDANAAPANRPHRVAIANWPTSVTDPRTASLDALLGHISSAGYEGLEFGPYAFARYFPGDSYATIAKKARPRVEQAGLRVFGATLHMPDANFRKLRWLDTATNDIKAVQDLGGEFFSCQFGVHPDYANSGGVWREDEDYLRWCADTIATLRDRTWSLGMNFYLEVHINMVAEDPAATCRLLELATCELNGDLSHLLYRGYIQGKWVQKIQQHMGHTHLRLARMHGDLSASVDDPKADWAAKGPTWQLFQIMKPALAHGLSSRTLSGETGPMHLVTKSLDLDASLVPLWRAMARVADAAAQGVTMKIDEPGDLKPWG